uniref:Epidermal growth factor-8 n=1 Tax=Schmidtea mediterranea TaxID=79327 RepID=A0A161HX36_SCHMD|nr:epidermal growth factor-8 [Schmidtea mediterranea]
MKMKTNITTLINVIIFGILISPITTKAILKVYIYNYQNHEDMKHDEKKCETFHWANDHCDPIFEICITEKSLCDVFKTTTNVFDNSKKIYNVFTQTFKRDKFINSISISVRVDDVDSGGISDHIAKFRTSFNIETPGLIDRKTMSVEPANVKVSLQASVSVKCALNYYGNKCEERSDKFICNSSCINGKCNFNYQKDTFFCQCYNGWDGINCNKSIFINNLSSSTKLPTKHTSQRLTTKYNYVVYVSSFDFSTTIIIISLIFVLCISLFSMIYVIRTTKKRNKKSSNLFTATSRPLPTITFTKNLNKESQDPIKQNTLVSQFNQPDTVYDYSTVQIGDSYSERNSNKQNMPENEFEDPYEVPLLSHIESASSTVDDTYEIPIKSEILKY